MGPGTPPGGGPPPALLQMILQRMHAGNPGGPGPGGPPGLGGPPPAGPGQPPGNGHGLNKTEVIQSLVQDIHDAMRVFPDPAHVAVLSKMLATATGLQKELMAPSEGPMKGSM